MKRAIHKVLKELGYTPDSVSVFFANEREMREIKRKSTGKMVESVDVLSFEEPEGFPHPESAQRFLGEVFVNKERYGNDPDRLIFLVIHGILHLIGFRHDRKRDTIEMQRIEKELCRKVKASE